MRARRIALIFGFLVLGLLVLLVLGAPYRVHLAESRVVILDRLAQASGLEIRVAGDLILQLGSWVGVEAEQVSLRNPAWEGEQSLLRADRIALELALLPLVSGHVKLGALMAENAEVNLQWDPAGRLNWQPKPYAAAPREGDEGGRLVPSERAALAVRNARIRAVDERVGRDITLSVRNASSKVRTDGKLIDLVIDADLNGTPIEARGSLASPVALLEADKPYPIDIEINALGITGGVRGTLANPRSGAELAVEINLHGKSLAGFAPWLGKRRASIGPLEAQMQFTGSGSSYDFAPLKLQIAEGELSGDVHLALGGERPSLVAQLDAHDLDLVAWLPEPKPRTDQVAVGDAERPGKVFSGQPLALHWMGLLDADVTLQAEAMKLPYSGLTDFTAKGLLKAKKLDIQAKGSAKGGTALSLGLGIDAGSSDAVATLKLDGDQLQVQELVANTAATGAVEGKLNVVADLRGRGRSVATIMAGLDGQFLSLLTDGKANLKQVDQIVGGAKAVLGQMVTPDASLAKVNCALISINFEHGKGELQSLLDTEYSTVRGSGQIDLAAETLKLEIDPKAKGVTLSVATPVTVEGALSGPSVRVDDGGVLATVTALVTKVTLPTLIFVDAFGDAVATGACTQILQQGGEYEIGGGDGKRIETGTKKGVEGLLKGTKKTVKGLFGEGNKASGEEPVQGEEQPGLH